VVDTYWAGRLLAVYRFLTVKGHTQLNRCQMREQAILMPLHGIVTVLIKSLLAQTVSAPLVLRIFISEKNAFIETLLKVLIYNVVNRWRHQNMAL